MLPTTAGAAATALGAADGAADGRLADVDHGTVVVEDGGGSVGFNTGTGVDGELPPDWVRTGDRCAGSCTAA